MPRSLLVHDHKFIFVHPVLSLLLYYPSDLAVNLYVVSSLTKLHNTLPALALPQHMTCRRFLVVNYNFVFKHKCSLTLVFQSSKRNTLLRTQLAIFKAMVRAILFLGLFNDLD